MLGESERANVRRQEQAGRAHGALTALATRRARRGRIDNSTTTNHVATTAASMTLGCLCALLRPPRGEAWVSGGGGPGQRQQQSIANKRWGRRSRIGVQPLLRRHHGGGICSAPHRQIGYNGDGGVSGGGKVCESRYSTSCFVGAREGGLRRRDKGALSYKAMCMVGGGSSGSCGDDFDNRSEPVQDSESISLRPVSSSSAAAVVATASAPAPSPLPDDNDDDARISDNGRTVPNANSVGADAGASVVQFTAVNGNNNSRTVASAAQPALDAAAASAATEAETPERQIEELGKKRRWCEVLKIMKSLDSPTREQYESAIMACSLSGQARHSLRIHTEMVAAGFEPTPVSVSRYRPDYSCSFAQRGYNSSVHNKLHRFLVFVRLG